MIPYWVSLATHGPRIDAGLRDTIDTVLLFDPMPDRIIVAVSGEEDRKKAHAMLHPWSDSRTLRVLDTGCRGPGKKIWPAMRLREELAERVAILTLDDDAYYQPDLPAVLARGADDFPGAVVTMTAWTLDHTAWDREHGFRYTMGSLTYGRGDGPNGCVGVWYPPGIPLDWRRLRAWSFDPRTEFSDDVFVGGECRRAGVPLIAVGGMFRLGIKPLAGPHSSDSSALYLNPEILERGLRAFCLCRLMPCPSELRGSECDPDAPPREETIFQDLELREAFTGRAYP